MAARRLIAMLAGAGVLIIAALVALCWWSVAAGAGATARVTAAEARAEIVASLVAEAHVYGEAVGAVLLLGKPRSDALTSARVGMERTLSRLDRVTRSQIAALGAIEEVKTQLPEVDATRRLIELYHGIDLSAARALVQQRNGNAAQALQLYAAEVQFRLDNELQPLLEASLAGERQDAVAGFERLAAQRQVTLWASLGLGALGIGAILVLAVLLGRTRRRDAQSVAAEAARYRREQEALAAELRDLDERRAQLLADVSHQLRTPLTILRGEADVALRAEPDPGQLRQALEAIRTEAVELGQLLEDLLVSARSDAESQGHAPLEVPLGEIVAAALAEGRALAEQREAGIEAVMADSGAVVFADPRRLRQALLVGIDNAVKHTAPGGKIILETRQAEGRALVRILDTGPGLDPAERPFLFDRFFRGRGEAELANEGLGIGLAIARAIIVRHQGTISLDNRPEGGAVLEVALPLVEGLRPGIRLGNAVDHATLPSRQ